MSKFGDNLTEEQKQNLRNAAGTEGKPYRKPFRGHAYVKAEDTSVVDRAIEKYGKESVELALIVKNNAEIRRFTSKNIREHLAAEGKVKDDDKVFVEFYWNKFSVRINGLSNEYFYTETFFLKSLVDSFEQFSNSATQTIGAFAHLNNIDVK